MNKETKLNKYKKYEKSIISFTNTIIDPWTMMIKPFNTSIAIIAMSTSCGLN